MNDTDILKLFRERSEDAIAATQTKYHALCFSLAKNILPSVEDATECVNDTWLAAWNAIPPAAPRSLSAFLCGITRNLSLKRLDYLLASKRSIHSSVSLTDLEGCIADANQDDLSASALAKLLSAFLRTESAESRVVFLRRYWFFDSIKEISNRFGYSQSKVKSMLFHTRNRLKSFLQKEGIDV